MKIHKKAAMQATREAKIMLRNLAQDQIRAKEVMETLQVLEYQLEILPS